MNVDFFDANCKEPPRREKKFGICDDEDGEKAYTDTINDAKWIAKVINDREIEVSFTAVDNCIQAYKNGGLEKESSCDGMLTFEDSLYLVELKARKTGGWLPDGK